MSKTKPMPGVALDTSTRVIVENPTGSGVIRTFEVVLVSTDAVNPVTINFCRRAGATGTRNVVPVGYSLEPKTTIGRKVVLGPGDRVEGNVSAAGDCEADVQQIYEEPA